MSVYIASGASMCSIAHPIGRKTYTTKIASTSYNTLALPRLQLKAVGIQEINSLHEIRKISLQTSSTS